jgi:hypothetical protein
LPFLPLPLFLEKSGGRPCPVIQIIKLYIYVFVFVCSCVQL